MKKHRRMSPTRETRLKISKAQKGISRWNLKQRLARSGEGNANRVLSDDDVIEMRALYTTGRYTLKTLAQKYNTHESNVSKIINRKTWTHI